MPVEKSGKKSRGRPFQPGGAQGPGRGPRKGAPNAGRPPSKFRRELQAMVTRAQAIKVAGRIISGDILEKLGTTKDGDEIVGETRNGDRLRAIEWAYTYLEGKPAGLNGGEDNTLTIKLVDERPRRAG